MPSLRAYIDETERVEEAHEIIQQLVACAKDACTIRDASPSPPHHSPLRDMHAALST